MPFIANSNGNFEYVNQTDRRPGYEVLGATPFVAPDLNLDGNSFGIDGALEHSCGGTLVAGIYAFLMEFLRNEPLVRAGGINRTQQLHKAKDAAWKYCKNNAMWIVLIGSVVAFLPGLAPLLGVAGCFGLGAMSYQLCRQFYAALSSEELQALRTAADEAGIQLNVPDPTPDSGKAAGYDESLSEPTHVPAGA